MTFLFLMLLQPPAPQPAAPATVTISAQQSPFPLAKNLTLYSAEVCSATARTISAAMIRQSAENAGVSFQDPALNSGILTVAASKTPQSRAMSIVKWSAVGISVAAGTVTYIKSQATQIGNAKDWAIGSVGTGALGAGIGILQPILQADVNTQAVSITSGVQAALISDMTNLYSVPAGGCMKSVMFFGAGPTILSVVKGTIP